MLQCAAAARPGGCALRCRPDPCTNLPAGARPVLPQEVLQITPHTLFKLLAALNECTEWGQVFILDCLAGYDMADPRDAEKIAERVMPRLQHANSAVVLSAVKVRPGRLFTQRRLPATGGGES